MLNYSVVKISTLLHAVIFLTSKTQDASAEEVGAYVPFVAVDAERGRFHASTKSELDRSSIGHKLLNSPITTEQLKGASILLISGPFQTGMTKPKEGENNEKLYSNSEIVIIEDFVERGGILIGAGLTWAWTYQAYGNKDPKNHPLNQIGEALDFSVLGQCHANGYEQKFVNFLKEQKAPEKIAFSASNVEFKGSYDKFIRSNKGYAGGGDKRGDGDIYIFGHHAILDRNPEFISTVFLGMSPINRTIGELVDNDAKEPETEKQQEVAPAIEPIPKVAASNINPLDLLAQEGSN